jgi:predicted fused transcriptional regulator/phosphomethylpyrimidine kinase
MLQEPNSLCLNELVDHVAEDGADGVEPLVRVADIRQARLVQKNLLNDKDSDRF